MRRQLVPALMMTIALTILTGLAYPLVVTGVAQGFFNSRANGSLVRVNGKVVGSSLLGQSFTDAQYFQPRPSAAGDGYDGLASSASNLGPSNPDLLKTIKDRAVAYRRLNGMAANAQVPVDAVTASASGLDPDISIANARLQAPRVARVRSLPLATVLAAVGRHTENRQWGFLGERVVNVLELNIDLDRLSAASK
ncbi:MAG: potassium-transporting ATPase KdpC subunit [Actinomycetota bacterium]|jgi:K+-transporting ATPase ATPase C chain|nr:potassium-transporting ATPase KdpC subunit [Actinomycetota bacterium]